MWSHIRRQDIGREDAISPRLLQFETLSTEIPLGLVSMSTGSWISDPSNKYPRNYTEASAPGITKMHSGETLQTKTLF